MKIDKIDIFTIFSTGLILMCFICLSCEKDDDTSIVPPIILDTIPPTDTIPEFDTVKLETKVYIGSSITKNVSYFTAWDTLGNPIGHIARRDTTYSSPDTFTLEPIDGTDTVYLRTMEFNFRFIDIPLIWPHSKDSFEASYIQWPGYSSEQYILMTRESIDKIYIQYIDVGMYSEDSPRDVTTIEFEGEVP